ncbi:MAG: cobalt-precorrin-5B (C(1))-methyltransferase CbiD [Candidatus Omnitrophota bacterium]|nr:cobalt-precorrin-5B (C(1))-methyltransferase CbiD [Candidatus Omnitrophota bacterium]
MNSTGLRRGFTTGTCAQAATKGACLILTQRKLIERVEVATPLDVRLSISLVDQEIGDGFGKCAVIKDSGDDPDVTNGAKIYAQVKFIDAEGVVIKGGEGVGKVTKPGLAIGVGEWAINPTPRKMISSEACKFLLEGKKGLEVVISVAKGKELAARTFNPNLGITGGISIIGTTGLVEPRSLDAYKASLALQLDVLKALGYNKAVFVLGYVGEKFFNEQLKLNKELFIKIGDHIGFMLEECAKRNIAEVLLIGHIGKLIKITNGQFNTHCSFGDGRLQSIGRFARACNADKAVIEEILAQKTAEAAIPILRKVGLSGVFDLVAKDVVKNCEEFMNAKTRLNCILLSLNGELLARTDEL